MRRKSVILFAVALMLVAAVAVVQAATFLNNTTPSGVPGCTDNGSGQCIWEFTASSDTVFGESVCIEVHPVGDGGNYIRVQCSFVSGTTWNCSVNMTANPAFANNTIEYQLFIANSDTSCNDNTYSFTGFNWQFSSGPNAIELAAFDATVNGSAVTLSWATASEIDHAGFNVLRGTDAAGADRVAVNGSLIAAQGSNGLGATYGYVDLNVPTGRYYYWLEALDANGGADIHGPVSAEVRVPTAVTLSAGSTTTPAASMLWAALLLTAALSASLIVRRRQTQI